MTNNELPKDLSSDELINLYKKMLLIREFEMRITKDFGKIRTPFVHTYTGEEAIAVGACAAINEEDYITSTHRGHGHFIAKGGNTNSLISSNLQSYIGIYLDNDGKTQFGLVLDAKIQTLFGSNEHVNKNKDIPEEIIKKSNLVEGTDFDTEGNLIGSFALAFKHEGKKLIYRLVRIDSKLSLDNDWQMGYVDPETKEVFYLLLTDKSGHKLYGRFVYKDGIIKDYGESSVEWWNNEELSTIRNANYLSDSGGSYGIQVYNTFISRYGNNYRIAGARTNLISPFLRYNVKHDFFQTLYPNFKGRPKGRKADLSLDRVMSYYTISDVLEEKTQDNLRSIYALVGNLINPDTLRKLLFIDDDTLEILNGRLEFQKQIKGEIGESVKGLDNNGVLSIFQRFFGTITKNDALNELLYKVCYITKSTGATYDIENVIIRDQTLKEWSSALYDMFESYTPTTTDRVDNLLKNIKFPSSNPFDLTSKIFSDTEFSWTEQLTALAIQIFGRGTFIMMITGSIFIKDNNLQFVKHSYNKISQHANKVGLSLPHERFLVGPLSRMIRENKLYRAQEILFSMFVLGLQIQLQTGPDIKNDYNSINMPTIPMEFVLPYFKNFNEVPQELHKSYFNTISQHITNLIGDISSDYEELVFPELRAKGNIELFNIFREIFMEKIQKSSDISLDQKKYAKMLVDEALIDLFSKSTKISDRVLIRDFLTSKGLMPTDSNTLTLASNYLKSFISMDFLSLELNSDLFKVLFQRRDYGAMIESLNPARIKDYVREYTMENILRAQRNAIVGLGNFLKKLSNNRILQIRPFKTYGVGLAYNEEISSGYLDYFPVMNNPSDRDQFFTLDGRSSESLEAFRKDYKKLLGGLLVDHQSFLISEVEEDGTLIHLSAFNLLEGALSESHFQPLRNQKGLVFAPVINDGTFDEITSQQLHTVMNQFYSDYGIISHERVGGNSATARKYNEYPLWMSTCTRLPFINYAF